MANKKTRDLFVGYAKRKIEEIAQAIEAINLKANKANQEEKSKIQFLEKAKAELETKITYLEVFVLKNLDKDEEFQIKCERFISRKMELENRPANKRSDEDNLALKEMKELEEEESIEDQMEEKKVDIAKYQDEYEKYSKEIDTKIKECAGFISKLKLEKKSKLKKTLEDYSKSQGVFEKKYITLGKVQARLAKQLEEIIAVENLDSRMGHFLLMNGICDSRERDEFLRKSYFSREKNTKPFKDENKQLFNLMESYKKNKIKMNENYEKINPGLQEDLKKEFLADKAVMKIERLIDFDNALHELLKIDVRFSTSHINQLIQENKGLRDKITEAFNHPHPKDNPYKGEIKDLTDEISIVNYIKSALENSLSYLRVKIKELKNLRDNSAAGVLVKKHLDSYIKQKESEYNELLRNNFKGSDYQYIANQNFLKVEKIILTLKSVIVEMKADATQSKSKLKEYEKNAKDAIQENFDQAIRKIDKEIERHEQRGDDFKHLVKMLEDAKKIFINKKSEAERLLIQTVTTYAQELKAETEKKAEAITVKNTKVKPTKKVQDISEKHKQIVEEEVRNDEETHKAGLVSLTGAEKLVANTPVAEGFIEQPVELIEKDIDYILEDDGFLEISKKEIDVLLTDVPKDEIDLNMSSDVDDSSLDDMLDEMRNVNHISLEDRLDDMSNNEYAIDNDSVQLIKELHNEGLILPNTPMRDGWEDWDQDEDNAEANAEEKSDAQIQAEKTMRDMMGGSLEEMFANLESPVVQKVPEPVSVRELSSVVDEAALESSIYLLDNNVEKKALILMDRLDRLKTADDIADFIKDKNAIVDLIASVNKDILQSNELILMVTNGIYGENGQYKKGNIPHKIDAALDKLIANVTEKFKALEGRGFDFTKDPEFNYNKIKDSLSIGKLVKKADDLSAKLKFKSPDSNQKKKPPVAPLPVAEDQDNSSKLMQNKQRLIQLRNELALEVKKFELALSKNSDWQADNKIFSPSKAQSELLQAYKGLVTAHNRFKEGFKSYFNSLPEKEKKDFSDQQYPSMKQLLAHANGLISENIDNIVEWNKKAVEERLKETKTLTTLVSSKLVEIISPLSAGNNYSLDAVVAMSQAYHQLLMMRDGLKEIQSDLSNVDRKKLSSQEKSYIKNLEGKANNQLAQMNNALRGFEHNVYFYASKRKFLTDQIATLKTMLTVYINNKELGTDLEIARAVELKADLSKLAFRINNEITLQVGQSEEWKEAYDSLYKDLKDESLLICDKLFTLTKEREVKIKFSIPVLLDFVNSSRVEAKINPVESAALGIYSDKISELSKLYRAEAAKVGQETRVIQAKMNGFSGAGVEYAAIKDLFQKIRELEHKALYSERNFVQLGAIMPLVTEYLNSMTPSLGAVPDYLADLSKLTDFKSIEGKFNQDDLAEPLRKAFKDSLMAAMKDIKEKEDVSLQASLQAKLIPVIFELSSEGNYQIKPAILSLFAVPEALDLFQKAAIALQQVSGKENLTRRGKTLEEMYAHLLGDLDDKFTQYEFQIRANRGNIKPQFPKDSVEYKKFWADNPAYNPLKKSNLYDKTAEDLLRFRDLLDSIKTNIVNARNKAIQDGARFESINVHLKAAKGLIEEMGKCNASITSAIDGQKNVADDLLKITPLVDGIRSFLNNFNDAKFAVDLEKHPEFNTEILKAFEQYKVLLKDVIDVVDLDSVIKSLENGRFLNINAYSEEFSNLFYQAEAVAERESTIKMLTSIKAFIDDFKATYPVKPVKMKVMPAGAQAAGMTPFANAALAELKTVTNLTSDLAAIFNVFKSVSQETLKKPLSNAERKDLIQDMKAILSDCDKYFHKKPLPAQFQTDELKQAIANLKNEYGRYKDLPVENTLFVNTPDNVILEKLDREHELRQALTVLLRRGMPNSPDVAFERMAIKLKKLVDTGVIDTPSGPVKLIPFSDELFNKHKSVIEDMLSSYHQALMVGRSYDKGIGDNPFSSVLADLSRNLNSVLSKFPSLANLDHMTAPQALTALRDHWLNIKPIQPIFDGLDNGMKKYSYKQLAAAAVNTENVYLQNSVLKNDFFEEGLDSFSDFKKALKRHDLVDGFYCLAFKGRGYQEILDNPEQPLDWMEGFDKASKEDITTDLMDVLGVDENTALNIIDAHSQGPNGLISQTLFASLGEGSNFRFVQPETRDRKFNIVNREGQIYFEVEFAHLKLVDTENNFEEVGRTGPSKAVFHLAEKDGKWGYQLDYVATNDPLIANAMKGMTFSPNEILDLVQRAPLLSDELEVQDELEVGDGLDVQDELEPVIGAPAKSDDIVPLKLDDSGIPYYGDDAAIDSKQNAIQKIQDFLGQNPLPPAHASMESSYKKTPPFSDDKSRWITQEIVDVKSKETFHAGIVQTIDTKNKTCREDFYLTDADIKMMERMPRKKDTSTLIPRVDRPANPIMMWAMAAVANMKAINTSNQMITFKPGKLSHKVFAEAIALAAAVQNCDVRTNAKIHSKQVESFKKDWDKRLKHQATFGDIQVERPSPKGG